jgi:hypothetical protein
MAKKGKIIPLQPISLKTYIVERARKLPIYKCWSIGDDFSGMKQIAVSRQKANGNLIVGFYLIDYFCLGLKDTFYREFDDEDELDDAFFNTLPHKIEFKEIDANYAQNFIYGSIEYAEDLGFEPAKDFRITEYLLDDVDHIEFIDIPFGEDGMPHYMAGKDDDIDKNLKILRENVGVDNFNYTNLADVDDDYEEDYDEEMDNLESLDDDEFIEKAEKIVANITNDQIKIALIVHLSILIQIDKLYDDVDDLLEKYKTDKEALVFEVRTCCIEKIAFLNDVLNTEDENTMILVLIEQYLHYEGIHFILHSDYQKALASFINDEFDSEQFHLLTTIENKILVWAIKMLDEIAAFLFKIDSFKALNAEQKTKALKYLWDDVNKDEAAKISENYEYYWDDFVFFNNEYYGWKEDDLKQELLKIAEDNFDE